MRGAVSAAFVILATSAGAALCAPADWRDAATRADQDRLGRLDEAWREALRQARAAGHSAEVDSYGALLKPTASTPRPHLTPGQYRCRTVKLGSPAAEGISFVAYGWFRCRVELTPGGDLTLQKLTGSQRTAGNLFPGSDRRLVYVGAQSWGDETGRAVYGRDSERDQVGVLERIGARRWRLVLPYPKQESVLDVLELVPVR